MAKTNLFENVECADWLTRQKNPDFDWEGFAQYQRAKKTKKETSKELSFWGKETLRSFGALLFAPFLTTGMAGVFVRDILGWSVEITVLIVAVVMIAAIINTASDAIESVRSFSYAACRYFDAVCIIKNAQK